MREVNINTVVAKLEKAIAGKKDLLALFSESSSAAAMIEVNIKEFELILIDAKVVQGQVEYLVDAIRKKILDNEP